MTTHVVYLTTPSGARVPLEINEVSHGCFEILGVRGQPGLSAQTLRFCVRPLDPTVLNLSVIADDRTAEKGRNHLVGPELTVHGSVLVAKTLEQVQVGLDRLRGAFFPDDKH